MAEIQTIQLFFKNIDDLDPEKRAELKEASIATLDQPLHFYVTDPDVMDALTEHPDLWFMVGGIYAAFMGDTDEPVDRLQLPDILGRITRSGNGSAQQGMADILRVLKQKDHTAENVRVVLVPMAELAENEGFPIDYPELLSDMLTGVDDPDAVVDKWNKLFSEDVD